MDEIVPDDSASNTGGENQLRRHEMMKREIMNSYNQNQDQSQNIGEKVVSVQNQKEKQKYKQKEVSQEIPQVVKEDFEERQNETEVVELMRKNVKEFLVLEDKIRRVNVVMRELRKQKKDLTECILDEMTSLGVENINLRQGGRLVAAKTETKVPLTKANIISTLGRHLGDNDQVMNIARILMEERDKTEKMKLKKLKK